VPKINGQPQVGKINHVVVVPAGFCVAWTKKQLLL
jgi:hypothetical protein